ncbi:MAG: tRNA (adenosine(37)-N6)-threonylcarbamoyltransferase complex dimerization subunit type 1 TsaB [Candidatus Nanopelagicales bacterium]|nr:tRNA (adenosine(37)-N6)-threonylcarbamoyltransferase complex dimerization subunit type 1 TsaB [Candidatus Nanopelagicales bacterium]
MIILALDTASAATSVALVDGDVILDSARHIDARRHAEVLAPMIAEVVAGRAVDAVVCGVGPGPYTGLRVGVASAQSLGLAWRVPVVGICSLDAIAHAAREAGVTGEFIAALDARRNEVYWARYGAQRLLGPYVNRPDELDPELLTLPWVGVGAEPRYPDASDLARIASPLLDVGVSVAERITDLAAHGTDDGATAKQLGLQQLLPPFPLYVRRPDAVAGFKS